jgi:flagellar biosynthesis protein
MDKRDIFQAFALELSNDSGTPPKLAARGDYDLARHIVACAKRHGIPIVERPEFCEALDALEVDQEIPAELFEIAAAILAEVGALQDTSAHERKPDHEQLSS